MCFTKLVGITSVEHQLPRHLGQVHTVMQLILISSHVQIYAHHWLFSACLDVLESSESCVDL